MQDTINQISQLLKEGYSQKSIVKKLERQGVVPGEIPGLLEQGYLLFTRTASRRKRLWFGISALAALFLMVFVMPIGFTGNHPAITSLLATVLFLSCLFTAIMAFPDADHRRAYFDRMDQQKNMAIVYLIVILSLIVCFILFYGYYRWEVRNEIARYGVVTEGVIYEGSAVTTQTRRRFNTHTSTSYTVKVAFRNKKGKQFLLEKEVESDVFNSVYQGMPVKVRYSSRHPDFFDLLYEPDTQDQLENILRQLNR